MRRFLRTLAVLSCLIALGFIFDLPRPTLFAQQRQIPGAFRGRVVLVPVDVRILDAHGNPVTDLTQEEFTVYEDDVPQEIGHFSTQAFTAGTPADGPPPLRSGPGLEVEPVKHRTFLILLGRGRLQEPSDGMDGVIEMVRSHLLPQDQVGVVAYNRAYGLTTDRESVIRLLESYREAHEEIESRRTLWFSGLRARHGSNPEMPPDLQELVDGVFVAADVPSARNLALGDYANADYDEERRAIADYLDMETDEFDELSGRTFSAFDDLRSIFAGIEFLRFLEGEKHLVFLSERGLTLPGRRGEQLGGYGQSQTMVIVGVEAGKQVNGLAELAADARVTLSPIQTGGLPASLHGAGVLGSQRMFQMQDTRQLAEQTGGVASFYRKADEAVDRLDRATRFQYLLGYYPAAGDWTGEYRRIRVEVDRPDVRVHYRHGYLAEDELVPYDRREFMAGNRILAAATDNRRIRDIRVTLAEPVVTDGPDGDRVTVNVEIDPERIEFREVGDQHVGALHVTLFVGGSDRALVGEQWERLDLRLNPETFARLEDETFFHTITVDAVGSVRYVKAVVYDYFGDQLGIEERRVR